jgi:hypothetical protein
MSEAARALVLVGAVLGTARTDTVVVEPPVPEGTLVEATLVGPTAISVHRAPGDSVQRLASVVALRGRARNGVADSLWLRLGTVRTANGAVVSLPGVVVAVAAAAVARVSMTRPNAGGTMIGASAVLLLDVGLREIGASQRRSRRSWCFPPWRPNS